jgi:hypothetical protein
MTDQERLLEELLRPLSPEEMEAEQKELDKIDWDAVLQPLPEPSGFPIMPHSPIWNPKPGPYYR